MTLPLRPQLEEIVATLLSRSEQNLTLDMVADAIGATAISVDEIDLVFRALESHDKTVGDEGTGSASAELAVTLTSARRLRGTLGRMPTPEEIAADAQISVTSVRGALLFARILQR